MKATYTIPRHLVWGFDRRTSKCFVAETVIGSCAISDEFKRQDDLCQVCAFVERPTSNPQKLSSAAHIDRSEEWVGEPSKRIVSNLRQLSRVLEIDARHIDAIIKRVWHDGYHRRIDHDVRNTIARACNWITRPSQR